MTTQIKDAQRRLIVIRTLHERIQKASPERLSISAIAHKTGIPPSSLGKWLKGDAVPRKSSFEVAVRALLDLLNSLLPEQPPIHAEVELRSGREALRTTQLESSEKYPYGPITIGFIAGILSGVLGTLGILLIVV